MKTLGARFLVLLCFGASLLASATAGAVVLGQRTFVSAQLGNDANACSPTSPCRTFAHAISMTAAGGEVIALDSGGYGPFTIAQAVSIIAPQGVYAGITVFSGDGIGITAGGTDVVILRGLTINGLGGANGVHFTSGGTLSVENCVLNSFTGAGILMSSAGTLSVKGTDVKGCSLAGIQISNSSGTVFSTIDHCHLDGNENGFQAQTASGGESITSAYYSTANHNFTGWVCGNASGGVNNLHLDFCTANQNTADGVYSDCTTSGAVTVSGSVILSNGGYGLEQVHASVVLSRGNNTVWGNALGSTQGTIGSFSGQ
jgi:Right handed beta helix region